MRTQILNLSGPYAVGKDTVINYLLEAFEGRLHRVRTLTTRSSDPGVDPSYTSLSLEDFDRITDAGNFVVNAQIGGTVKYATDLDEIASEASSGHLCIHSVFAGPAGAGALRAALGGELRSIALVPPGDSTLDKNRVLRERLIRRGRDNERVIEARLSHQQDILEYIAENPLVSNGRVFDEIMVSDDLEVLLSEMQRLTQEILDSNAN
jgi:guanylate kinase